MAPVVVARFTTIGEAEIARSALRASGIEVAIADEHIIAIDWLASNAVGGVKLLVREEDRDRAARIIAGGEVEEDALADDVDDSSDDEELCPNCASAELVPIPRLKIFALAALAGGAASYVLGYEDVAIAAIAASALILLFAPSHRCASCGERLHARRPIDSERAVNAPLPDAHDLADQHCPRCGSPEYHHIDYRRLKAIPLLFSASMVVAGPMWLMLPKRLCDACGFKR